MHSNLKYIQQSKLVVNRAALQTPLSYEFSEAHLTFHLQLNKIPLKTLFIKSLNNNFKR